MTNYPQWAWSGSRDPFFNFDPNHTFGVSEARHIKFHAQTDTNEHSCMHDRLPPKGMCSGSRYLFKIWEISSNISETVQDRHIVVIED